MKISLVEEMRAIDAKAKDEYGIPELVLMENAGHRTAEAVCELLGQPDGKSVIVLAGTGNNGGDAFAAARHLVNTAIIPALPSEETHDFALQFEKSGYYEETGHPCHEDFMRFALLIGLREERAERLLKPFTTLPFGLPKIA